MQQNRTPRHGMLLCLFIILTVLVSACDSSSLPNEHESAVSQSVIQKEHALSGTFLVCANEGLRITDLQSGATIYACNQPSCNHASGNNECLAYPDSRQNEGEFSYAFLQESFLYFFIKKYDKYSFCRSKTDGSERIVLCELPVTAILGEELLLVGNKLYLAGKKEILETNQQGYTEVKSAKLLIYEIDIENGKAEVLTEHEAVYGVHFSKMLFSKGYLHFSFSEQHKSWKDTPYENPADRMNFYINATVDDYAEINRLLDVRECNGCIVLSERKEIISICKDGIYSPSLCSADEKQLLFYTKEALFEGEDTDNLTQLYPGEGDSPAKAVNVNMLNNQTLVSVTIDFEQPKRYFSWSAAEGLQEIPYAELNGIIIQLYGGGKALTSITPLKASSSSSEWRYALIDIDSIFSGKWDWMDLGSESPFHQKGKENE